MIRRSALDSIGGFATGTATEDIHTSLRLHASGWKSVFVPESLAVGLEAESLKEFFRQRRRWAAGSLGLLIRSPDSPLRAPGLNWQQRLNYVNATLAHVLGLQKVASFVLPVACVMAVASPVTINWAVASYVLLGFTIFSIGLTYVFSRGTYHPILTEAYMMANSVAHISGLWGVIKVQKKFSVSRKLAPKSERTWLKVVLWGIVGVAVAGLIRSLDLLATANGPHAKSTMDLVIISLCLIGYNLITFLWFFGYLITYERRRAGERRSAAGGARPRKRRWTHSPGNDARSSSGLGLTRRDRRARRGLTSGKGTSVRGTVDGFACPQRSVRPFCGAPGGPRDQRRPERDPRHLPICTETGTASTSPATDPMSLPAREQCAEIRRRHTLGGYRAHASAGRLCMTTPYKRPISTNFLLVLKVGFAGADEGREQRATRSLHCREPDAASWVSPRRRLAANGHFVCHGRPALMEVA